METLAQFKERIYGYLLDCMTKALEKGAMTADESTQSAAFATTNMEAVTNLDSAIDMFRIMTGKWPIYSPALLKLQDEQQKIVDQAKIDKIEQELHNIDNG